jgi:hypothetical protein
MNVVNIPLGDIEAGTYVVLFYFRTLIVQTFCLAILCLP